MYCWSVLELYKKTKTFHKHLLQSNYSLHKQHMQTISLEFLIKNRFSLNKKEYLRLYIDTRCIQSQGFFYTTYLF